MKRLHQNGVGFALGFTLIELLVVIAIIAILARIVDYPAAYHGNAAGILFADGHAEVKKWRDPRTTPPLKRNGEIALGVLSPNNPDAA